MDENKKRQIEEKLRELFMLADESRDSKRPAIEKKTSGPQVIRRRKGSPDLQVA